MTHTINRITVEADDFTVSIDSQDNVILTNRTKEKALTFDYFIATEILWQARRVLQYHSEQNRRERTQTPPLQDLDPVSFQNISPWEK